MPAAVTGTLRSWRAAGDAAAVPLRDGASGLTVAMHMLCHLTRPRAPVRELRRITRPGGRVLVILNGADHLRKLRDLIGAARERAPQPGMPPQRML